MPYYSIFPFSREVKSSNYVELDYAGRHVLAYKADYGYVLERVFSTNPKDFADPNLTPGILLENSLIKKLNK